MVDDLDDGSELSLTRSIGEEDYTSNLDVPLERALGRLGCGGHTIDNTNQSSILLVSA